MKKFLCALMMAVLALGITACGGAAEQSAPAPAAKTQTAAPAADGGKTVITFCTSGGSPISDSTPDINKWFKGATVIEGIRAYPDDTAATEKWLAGLNL